MGKWIRHRFFLIAGKLVRCGRRFILKLSEDWAYRKEYNEAEGRLEDWLGLHKVEKGIRGRQKRQYEESPSITKVCPNIKEADGSTQILGYGQTQRAFSSYVNRYWERKSVLTRGYFFKIVGIEKVYA
jgi:hypothetical protein